MTRIGQILLALCLVSLTYAALAHFWPDPFAPADGETVATVFVLVGIFGLAYSLFMLLMIFLDSRR